METWSVSRVFASTRVVGLFLPGQIFSVKDKFVVGCGPSTPIRFNWVVDRFLWYFGMVPYLVEHGVVLLECHVLAKEFTSTKDMFKAVGGPGDQDAFVTVPEVYALLLGHAEDRENCALSSNHGNIFFLQGTHESSWILNLTWCENSGWIVTFCESLIPHNWLKNQRVFSRHKFKPAV
ncbi:MAG: hypothetical protein A2534_01495 [Candidatus Magasanikbacteria bacterium RIFOXYD2_FULL_39_9]|uniref:Uncharacterized protein n=1 Tax=Candidatus Magasanikbacteria bacterium RIFOXYD1_FULL_40_23 TaxID=1798705 RepID=A0A1F6P946_9BACT|nr:MAG: hypothetical protein A2534_01495 [Candidatus Magasanikbacteria bacterium RIFOXYD2_FULL_39_9]OGH92560.1 MAG: hypothetical protein A2563_02685 [Candidatus Magasanikbacteria bacterium RIFOXYD1_FULL_40_23]